MAYGLWLYKEIVNDTRKKTRLEVEKRDYSGQSYEITALSGDVVLSIDGGSATDPIVKSNLSFSIIDTAQVTYSDFFTPDATLYRVKVYDVNGQTQTVRWTGFITPDSFGEPLTYRGQINLTARDNLGYLNDLEFDYNNATAESYTSIKNIINAAIAKIGGMPLVWNVAKKASTAADGTFDNIEDAIVSTYTMLGDNWGNVVSELLKGIGCQLRYIDNNAFAVYDIEVLSDSATFTAQQIQFLEQSGYREIQPAWKKGIFNQDYGFVSEFSLPLPNSYSGSLVYIQSNEHRKSYGNNIYLKTSIQGWTISRGDALSPQMWGVCDPYAPDDPDYTYDRDAIYLPFSDIDNDAVREKMYIQKSTTISRITAPIDVTINVHWSTFLSPNRWPQSEWPYIEGLYRSRSPYPEYDAKDFIYNIILDGEDGNRYYFREEWMLEDELTDRWLIARIPPKLDTDYMTIRNIVQTTPCGGTLIMRIYAPSGEFCYQKMNIGQDRYESFHLESSLKIKSITISNDIEVSGGKSRLGSISEAHNVVNDEEYLYGQIPSASYGIEFMKGGIFKNNAAYTPYSHFKRNSTATATDNLLDLIGRETIQYHKKSWDILSGTVQVTDRTSVMRFGTLTYGGKRYLPISAALNLLANQMSVTSMLEIENYVEEADIMFGDYTGKNSYSSRGGGSSSSGGASISSHNQLAGREDNDSHPLSAITGLSNFKSLFDSMFEKVTSGNDWYIRAKKDFASMGGLTAYALNPDLTTHLYDLGDVPIYIGQTNKYLKVNGSGSLEWAEGGGGGSNVQWGTEGADYVPLSVNSVSKNILTHHQSLANYYTKGEVDTALGNKQNAITDLATIRSNAANGNTAYGWGNHASQGYLTGITKQMVENVLTGNISSHTHSEVHNARHVNPTTLSTLAGNTVLDYKNALANTFSGIGEGIGDNVTVPYELITYWAEDTHVVHENAVYSVIKIGGGYSGSTYGQWLLSSYEDADLYLLGKGYNGWGAVRKIYHSGNLLNLSQLTDNLGSNPVHTHGQYLPSSVAVTTYHPKGGSTALALSAASLMLAGAISGATNITASGTGVMKELVLSNNGHTVKIELDSNGNLKINGNVVATGGLTLYQS